MTKFKQYPWSISPELFNWILENIPENSTILELGSGMATEHLCRYYKVYSVEHDSSWCNKYDSNYIYAPIKDYKLYKWYDLEILESSLPQEYDIILVDGPPGSIGREGFLHNLELFKDNVPIIFDDTNRSAEKTLMESVNKKLNREIITIYDKDQNKESKILL